MYVTIVKERKSGEVSYSSVMSVPPVPESKKQPDVRCAARHNPDIDINVQDCELRAVVLILALHSWLATSGRPRYCNRRLTYNRAKRYVQIRSKE